MIDFRRSQFGAKILCMCQHYLLFSGRPEIIWMDDTCTPHTTRTNHEPRRQIYTHYARTVSKRWVADGYPLSTWISAGDAWNPRNPQNLQNLQKQGFAGFAALAGFSVSGIIGGYSSWQGVAVCHPCFGHGPSVVYICHLGSWFVRVVCGVQVSSIQVISDLPLNKR